MDPQFIKETRIDFIEVTPDGDQKTYFAKVRWPDGNVTAVHVTVENASGFDFTQHLHARWLAIQAQKANENR